MISELIWLTLLLIGLTLSLRSVRWGLLYYLCGALVFPVMWVGETALRFELVFCPWLLTLVLVNRMLRRRPFRWHPVLSRYVLFLGAIIVATCLVIPSTGHAHLFTQAAAFYGIVRPLLVMFLFLNVPLSQELSMRVLWLFVWASIPLALLSIGQSLGLDPATRVTLAGYVSPWRTPAFAMVEQGGWLIRSTGVFESPVYNAAYFLLVLTAGWFLLVQGKVNGLRRWVLYLSFGLAFVGGVTTLSATFLAGLAVCAGMLLILSRRHTARKKLARARYLRATVGTVGIVGILALCLLPGLLENPAFAGNLHYQVDRILSGKALDTRYDPETGLLIGTIKAIMQRPILGWGLHQTEGAFVGDSIYVSVAYRAGVVGLGLFLWTIWSILSCAWRAKQAWSIDLNPTQIMFMWTVVLLAAGVGSPAFFLLRLQEWYWALVGLTLFRGLVAVKERGVETGAGG